MFQTLLPERKDVFELKINSHFDTRQLFFNIMHCFEIVIDQRTNHFTSKFERTIFYLHLKIGFLYAQNLLKRFKIKSEHAANDWNETQVFDLIYEMLFEISKNTDFENVIANQRQTSFSYRRFLKY